MDIHALDVADESATVFLAEHLDGLTLDVLINNAGIMAEKQSVNDVDFEQWMSSFVVDTIAPWRISLSLL